MTPENVDAILQGAQIELVAVVASDSCEGNNVAYGVLTGGWRGKALPYTYSGEGGPSTGILNYTFTDDTALLVFWSASFTMPQPAFFGLAPEGPFEEVAALP